MTGDADGSSTQPLRVEGETRWVQSCISAVGFPDSLDQVLEMANENLDLGITATDMDRLLEFDPTVGCYWSAPRWISGGDILFFYHTKRARIQIARLRRQAEPSHWWRKLPHWFPPFLRGKEQRLTRILEHAADLADRYSGTIFACALVGGPAERLDNNDGSLHFRDPIFAELADVHVFDHPLSHDEFSELVRIRRQATSTPLAKQGFDGIKRCLSTKNEFPPFLRDAKLGDSGFRNVNEANWPKISCAPHTRFLHETQIRAYLLDFLLRELKDAGTPLLEECRCFRNGKRTGLADYFVRVHGTWCPVEAKLNVLAEGNLSAQVGKYIHVESFVPTKGRHRGTVFPVQDSSICLVADQMGIYLTADGEFRKCRPGAPLWKRIELDQATVAAIREYLRTFASGK